MLKQFKEKYQLIDKDLKQLEAYSDYDLRLRHGFERAVSLQLGGPECESYEKLREFEYFPVVEFLTRVILLGFEGIFDNDKPTKRFRERIGEVVQEDGEDWLFPFGYVDLMEVLAGLMDVQDKVDLDRRKEKAKTGVALLSQLRAIDGVEYKERGLYYQDLRVVAFLLSERLDKTKTSRLDVEEVFSYLQISDMYKSIVDVIALSWRCQFEGGFLLTPSYGVLSGDNRGGKSCYRVEVNSTELSYDKKTASLFKQLYTYLESKYQLKVSQSRQFDIKEICSESKVVYYPKKMLEIAMGRKLLTNVDIDIYEWHGKQSDYDAYEAMYIYPMLKAKIKGAMLEIIEDVMGITEAEVLLEEEVIQQLRGYLEKVKRSFTLCFLVSRCNILGGALNSIVVSMASEGQMNEADATKIFRGLKVGQVVSVPDVVDLAKGRHLPFKLLEYRQDFDIEVTQAEPLFGYKAVELLLSNNKSINWEHILVGEGTTGLPVFSTVEGQAGVGGISLQRYLVHNIISETRAGKGLQTMNLTGTAIASNKAVFFQDRKPDLLVEYGHMAKGDMYLVNGGQYLSQYDPDNDWGETGRYLGNWRKWLKYPDYLEPFFGKASELTYYGTGLGDYIYFRGLQFTMSLLLARVHFANNPTVFKELGGSEGLLIVFDEFNNWVDNFELRYLGVQGVFAKHMLLTKDKEEYKENRLKMRYLKEDIESEENPSKVKQMERKLDEISKRQVDLLPDSDLYAEQMLEKYENLIRGVMQQQNAGLNGTANEESGLSDIFIIGQNLRTKGHQGPYPRRDSGRYNVNETTKGKSMTRGLFDLLKSDFIMGRNISSGDVKHYMGCQEDGSRGDKWLTDKRYWGYIGGVDVSDVEGKMPRGTTIFKPYLVLNNHLEDDPENPELITDTEGNAVFNPNYRFVTGCRNRVNQAKSGLWETVRLKHVKDTANPLYGTLNEGVGYEGYIKQIMGAQHGVSGSVQDVFKKSKTIADYVAHKMGYASYWELLFDLRPEGLFDYTDMIRAIENPNTYQDVEARCPVLTEYDFFLSKESRDEEELGVELETELQDWNERNERLRGRVISVLNLWLDKYPVYREVYFSSPESLERVADLILESYKSQFVNSQSNSPEDDR